MTRSRPCLYAVRPLSQAHDAVTKVCIDMSQAFLNGAAKQRSRLESLTGHDLKTARAYQIRLAFQDMFTQPDRASATAFLKKRPCWKASTASPKPPRQRPEVIPTARNNGRCSGRPVSERRPPCRLDRRRPAGPDHAQPPAAKMAAVQPAGMPALLVQRRNRTCRQCGPWV